MTDSPQTPDEPATSSRIGQGMLTLFWLLVLGLTTLFCQDYLEKRENPNHTLDSRTHSSGLREVVLQRNAYGHYVSPGKINGVDVTFFLDTGATGVSIPEHIAEKIGLQRGYQYQSSTANGTIDVYSAELDKVELGAIQLYDVRGSINPHYEEDDILLGMSFLKHLEMAQKGSTLTLRQ